MDRSILCGILFLFSNACFANKVFEFNDNCKLAYHEIVKLKLQNGQALIDLEKANNPENLVPAFLENYIDFFNLFFNENAADFSRRKKLFDRRLSLLSQGPQDSPFYLFSRGVMHFQWASIKLKYGHLWDGGWELRHSYFDILENTRKFPQFSPNLFYEGAMQVAISTIPDGYKWLGSLVGLNSNGEEGWEQLETFLTQSDEWAQLFREEATFHYLMLKYYVKNEKDQVFTYIKKRKLDLKNNHLFTYLAVNLSLNNQQSANAEKLIAGMNHSPEYLQTTLWDLENGYAKMNHLDEEAETCFKNYLQKFKGKYYLKDVLYKLSLFYYLKGDQASADQYRAQVLRQGNTIAEADQLALREAKAGEWPDKLLLKARLLNDGGYNHEALVLLQGKQMSDFDQPQHQIEFLYRVGRIYDDVNRDEEAAVFYKQVIAMGEKRKEYYAARSALQLGFIAEQDSDKKMAGYWFNRCLAMKNHDFKNSLDQRAKAGLARVL